MHHVNLIARRRALQVSAKRLVRAGALGVLGALGLASLSTALLMAQLRVVEIRAEQMVNNTRSLRPQLERLERAQRTRERYADMGRYYLQARQSQDLWVGWLRAVWQALPSDAWVTSVDTQPQAGGKSLVIDGRAHREESVSTYLASLGQNHALLKGGTPRLEFMRMALMDMKTEVREFRISVPLAFGPDERRRAGMPDLQAGP